MAENMDHMNAASLCASGLANLQSVEAVLQPIEDLAAPAKTASVIGFGTGLHVSQSCAHAVHGHTHTC